MLRTEQINLKLTDEELAKLKRLAERHAVTPQSYLRILLKRAERELPLSNRFSKGKA